MPPTRSAGSPAPSSASARSNSWPAPPPSTSESFYEQRQRDAPEPDDVLVLSCDGKGVVMRPEALRAQTRKQADSSQTKLKTRLSRGEKRGRKRMAEVAAVYEITPRARTPADILPATDPEREAARPEPRAKNKWVCASVSDDSAQVIARMFDEASRRDPDHQQGWIALVDGGSDARGIC